MTLHDSLFENLAKDEHKHLMVLMQFQVGLGAESDVAIRAKSLVLKTLVHEACTLGIDAGNPAVKTFFADLRAKQYVSEIKRFLCDEVVRTNADAQVRALAGTLIKRIDEEIHSGRWVEFAEGYVQGFKNSAANDVHSIDSKLAGPMELTKDKATAFEALAKAALGATTLPDRVAVESWLTQTLATDAPAVLGSAKARIEAIRMQIEAAGKDGVIQVQDLVDSGKTAGYNLYDAWRKEGDAKTPSSMAGAVSEGLAATAAAGHTAVALLKAANLGDQAKAVAAVLPRVEAAAQVAQAASLMISTGGWGAALAGVQLIGGLGGLGALGGLGGATDKNPQESVMAAIQALQTYIRQQFEHLNERLDHIESTLGEILKAVQELGAKVEALASMVGAIQMTLLDIQFEIAEAAQLLDARRASLEVAKARVLVKASPTVMDSPLVECLAVYGQEIANAGGALEVGLMANVTEEVALEGLRRALSRPVWPGEDTPFPWGALLRCLALYESRNGNAPKLTQAIDAERVRTAVADLIELIQLLRSIDDGNSAYLTWRDSARSQIAPVAAHLELAVQMLGYLRPAMPEEFIAALTNKLITEKNRTGAVQPLIASLLLTAEREAQNFQKSWRAFEWTLLLQFVNELCVDVKEFKREQFQERWRVSVSQDRQASIKVDGAFVSKKASPFSLDGSHPAFAAFATPALCWYSITAFNLGSLSVEAWKCVGRVTRDNQEPATKSKDDGREWTFAVTARVELRDSSGTMVLSSDPVKHDGWCLYDGYMSESRAPAADLVGAELGTSNNVFAADAWYWSVHRYHNNCNFNPLPQSHLAEAMGELKKSLNNEVTSHLRSGSLLKVGSVNEAKDSNGINFPLSLNYSFKVDKPAMQGLLSQLLFEKGYRDGVVPIDDFRAATGRLLVLASAHIEKWASTPALSDSADPVALALGKARDSFYAWEKHCLLLQSVCRASMRRSVEACTSLDALCRPEWLRDMLDEPKATNEEETKAAAKKKQKSDAELGDVLLVRGDPFTKKAWASLAARVRQRAKYKGVIAQNNDEVKGEGSDIYGFGDFVIEGWEAYKECLYAISLDASRRGPGLAVSALQHSINSLNLRARTIKFSFAKLRNAYPTSETPDFFKELGGEWPSKVKDGKIVDVNYQNTCAVRLSVALGKVGLTIPKETKEAITGDGRPLILKVETMDKFLKAELGASSWQLPKNKGDAVALSQMPKVSGIIVYHAAFDGATGHFDLWDSSANGGHGNFVGKGNFEDIKIATDIALWEIS